MFNVKETPLVGYVTPSGDVRTALVNSVNTETSNPNLTVLEMVDDSTHDPHGAPGTWHYLEGQESVPSEPAVVEDEPATQGEELSEPA